MKLFSHECVCLLCLNIFNDTFTTQEYLLKTKHISNYLRNSLPYIQNGIIRLGN